MNNNNHKFTQTEWQLKETENDHFSEFVITTEIDGCKLPIATTGHTTYLTGKEIEANAKVITVAPKMFTMLECWLDKVNLSPLNFYEKYGFNVSDITMKTEELLKQATE